MTRAGLSDRYLRSDARYLVEAELADFLGARARGRAVWDFGAGVPPVPRAAAGRLRTVDHDRSACPTVQADLEALAFADGALEAGVSLAVLEHVRHPERVVREMARVLAPGAPVFVWVPFLHEVHDYPEDHWRFTPQGLRELVEEAGFVTESVTSVGLTGLSVVAAHLYRFLVPPLPRRFRWRLAGFAATRALRPLDRLAPALDLPIGTTWVGSKRGG